MAEGGCRCGAVRYRIDGNDGEAEHHALCHYGDCRASAGAPAVAWMAVKEDRFTLLQGDPATFEGSPGALRQFCPTCGTGLFYRNAEVLPGIVDVQSATLDNAADYPPAAQIQCAERLPWMTALSALPEFERYPAGM